MKASIKKHAALAAFAATALMALAPGARAASSASQDLETLGGNRNVEDRAARLSSTTQSTVVQGRDVDRTNRFELGTYYGPVAYGNSYINSQVWAGMAEFHVVPQFSLGVRYEHAFNQLTNEGQAALDAARNGNATSYPDIDFPQYSIMGTATWYAFYGKFNFFDLKVVQFDVYAIGGAGQVTTSRDTSATYTGGGGIGFWISQHITSRFEIRYQTYKDHPYTGERDLNLIVATLGLGVLL